MEEWYQNPEAFHHEQDMVQWTEKLRPCAEALYIVLFENHIEVGILPTIRVLLMLNNLMIQAKKICAYVMLIVYF